MPSSPIPEVLLHRLGALRDFRAEKIISEQLRHLADVMNSPKHSMVRSERVHW